MKRDVKFFIVLFFIVTIISVLAIFLNLKIFFTGNAVYKSDKLIERFNFEQTLHGDNRVSYSGFARANNDSRWIYNPSYVPDSKTGNYSAFYNQNELDYGLLTKSNLYNPGTESFSYALWVKVLDDKGNILQKYDSGNYYFLRYQDGVFYSRGAINGSDFSVYSLASYNDNNWHHVAVVFDRKLNKHLFYVDGELVNSRNIPSGSLTNEADVRIAGTGNENNLDTKFNGYIDDLRFYRKALSEEEIESLAGVVSPIPPQNFSLEPISRTVGQCFDSDGGNGESAKYIKGYVTDSSTFGDDTKVYDECEGDYIVRENVCSDFGMYEDSFISCEFGCVDGACLYVAPEIPVDSCYDNDGGIEIYNKGAVLYEEREYTDSCYMNGNIPTLLEYFCSVNDEDNTLSLGEYAVPCPGGCENGACLNPYFCGNSDGGGIVSCYNNYGEVVCIPCSEGCNKETGFCFREIKKYEYDFYEGLVSYFGFEGNLRDSKNNLNLEFWSSVLGDSSRTYFIKGMGGGDSGFSFEGNSTLVGKNLNQYLNRNQGTIIMNVKTPDEKVSGNQFIFSSNFNGRTYFIYRPDNSFEVCIGGGIFGIGAKCQLLSTSSMTEYGEWYQIGMSWENGKMNAYYAGRKVNLYPIDFWRGMERSDFYIGSFKHENYFFEGGVENIFIYNRTLSEEEIYYLRYRPECMDGIDNDRNGKIDYIGGDLSCVLSERGVFHDDEIEQCSDGVDNDGDGFCDWDGCWDDDFNFLPPDADCVRTRGVSESSDYDVEIGLGWDTDGGVRPYIPGSIFIYGTDGELEEYRDFCDGNWLNEWSLYTDSRGTTVPVLSRHLCDKGCGIYEMGDACVE